MVWYIIREQCWLPLCHHSLLFLNIMLHESNLHVHFFVLVVVMRLTGKCVICTTVQTPIDQTDNEHLHDHHLLTQHCEREREREKKSHFQMVISPQMWADIQRCFLLEARAWEEKGGEQAMVPSKARMLMIDVCSWLSTSISWGENQYVTSYTQYMQSICS